MVVGCVMCVCYGAADGVLKLRVPSRLPLAENLCLLSGTHGFTEFLFLFLVRHSARKTEHPIKYNIGDAMIWGPNTDHSTPHVAHQGVYCVCVAFNIGLRSNTKTSIDGIWASPGISIF
jgi:hypothetical protein